MATGTDVWINVALWILGWFPGVIHAWYPLLWLYLTIGVHMGSGGSSLRMKAPSGCRRITICRSYPFWARLPLFNVIQRRDNVDSVCLFVSPLYHNRSVKYHSFRAPNDGILFHEISMLCHTSCERPRNAPFRCIVLTAPEFFQCAIINWSADGLLKGLLPGTVAWGHRRCSTPASVVACSSYTVDPVALRITREH